MRNYALILVVGLAATALWLAKNDWRIPKVHVPEVGPAPGNVELRSPANSPGALVLGADSGVSTRTAQEQSAALVETTQPKYKIRVVNEHGTGIALAQVRSLRDHETWELGKPWEIIASLPAPLAVADEEGRFDSPALVSGIRVVVWADGWRPALVTIVNDGAKAQEVVLYQASGTVLQILDERGGPVQGAHLLLPASALRWTDAYRPNAYYDVAQSGGAGRVSLWNDLVPFEVAMVVADGFSPAVFSLLRPLEVDSTQVTLRPAAEVSGWVRDNNGRSKFVVVMAESETCPVPSPRYAPLGRVSEDEGFLFERLAAGVEYVLTPCIDIGGELNPCGPSVKVTAPKKSVELSMFEGFSLSVHAVDETSRGVRVDILTSLVPRAALAEGRSAPAPVDPGGAVTWSSLPWLFGQDSQRVLELWLVAAGYESRLIESVTVRRGSLTDLGQHTLTRVNDWEIHVLSADDRSPISGATVRYLPEVSPELNHSHPLAQEVTTGVEGTARLSCVENAVGTLLVAADGFGPNRLQRGAEDCEPMQVLLSRPGIVAVRCETFQKTPVAGTTIQWRSTASLGWNPATSGDDGVIEIEVPAGDVTIRHAPGLVDGRTPGGSSISVDLHDAAKGQPRLSQEMLIPGVLPREHREVVLVVPALSTLELLVTIDGQVGAGCQVVGVPGTRLDIVDIDLWGLMNVPKAVVPTDGLVELRGLPAGSLLLSAALPKTGFVDHLEIEVYQQFEGAVSMEIETARRSVRVMDRAGLAVGGARVKLRQRSFQDGIRLPPIIDAPSPAGFSRRSSGQRREAMATTDESGFAHFDLVPNQGTFEASIIDPAQHEFAPAQLGPRQLEAVLRSGTGASFRLSLAHPDGRPAASMDYMLRGVEPRLLFSGKSGSAGEVVVGGLAPGAYRIWIGREEAREITLIAGERLELPIVLGE